MFVFDVVTNASYDTLFLEQKLIFLQFTKSRNVILKARVRTLSETKGTQNTLYTNKIF